MGGSTKSSTSSSNTTHTTTSYENQDRRLVVDGGGLGVSGDGNRLNVTMTDAGAIEGAFDLSKTSAALTAKSVADALGFAGDTGRGAFDLVAKAIDAVSTNAAKSQEQVGQAYANSADVQAGNKPLVIAGMIVAGVAAISVFGKR